MSISVIDIIAPGQEQKWNEIELSEHSAQITKRFSLIAMQFSKDEIAIVGGTHKLSHPLVADDNQFILNVPSSTVRKVQTKRSDGDIAANCPFES